MLSMCSLRFCLGGLGLIAIVSSYDAFPGNAFPLL
jgi:hypothetical protein